MNPKQLLFHDDARAKIRSGVDALAEAVKVTLGPRGRTVILERDFGPPQIVNSGVLVAKSIDLEDRFENMGAQLLREVAATETELKERKLRVEDALHAGDEPSVVLNRVDESTEPAFGFNAATRTYGDLLQMGVIDPAKPSSELGSQLPRGGMAPMY